MHNREVAEMLERAARILALRGENRYRVRAYKRAARAVAVSELSIGELIRSNRLQSLEGVGAGLADKIREIHKTGQLSLLERMESGKLPDVEDGRFVLLASALTLATEIVPAMADLPGIKRVQLTGSARRRCETIYTVPVVIGAGDLAAAREGLKEWGKLHHLRWDGNFCRAVHSYGIAMEIYLVHEDDFTLTLWSSTGTPAHTRKVAEEIRKKTGRDLLNQERDGEPFIFSSEEEIYRLADLPYIEPELREDRGEVEAALAGILPSLVEASHYRGDLHTHTDWSDGTSTIEKMTEAAAELGYRYLAVTDHSKSLKVARGLSLEKLAEQRAYIRKLDGRFPNLRIFTGIEADILDDGSLDAPDEVLAEMDVVIASVHSGFRQTREKLTGRICRAMQNPYVQFVAHATGRLLGKRVPYEVDMDEVIRTAVATGTALEINSSPDRLDLNDEYARKAKEAGVKLAVNTDSHNQLELANVLLGLSVARRAWLTRDDVLNTKETDEILAVLQAKRKRNKM